MTLRAAGLLFVLTAFAATLATESGASGPYHFEVDSFCVTQGSGTTCDEFDVDPPNPSLGPFVNWTVQHPRARQENGAAILESLGDIDMTPVGPDLYSNEHTEIETKHPSVLDITLDGGDATATSTWLPVTLPGADQLYGMTAAIDFNVGGSSYDEDFFVYIVNAVDLAASVGAEEGLYMGFNREIEDQGWKQYLHKIDEAQFDGSQPLILQLVFDQAESKFVASFFSADGQTGSAEWPIIHLGGVAEFDDWTLGVHSFTLVPEPSTALLLGVSLAALSAARSRARRRAVPSTRSRR